MLEEITDLPPDLTGIRARGTVSRADYDRVFEPLLAAARRDGRRLRVLYEFAPDFTGFTPGAAWEDAKLGLRNLRLFNGCAVVSDREWLRDAAHVVGVMLPCPVRAFPAAQRGAAVEWLAALPAGAATSHRLIPDAGVLVVEVHEALRVEDFDAIAATADAWIEAHGDLRGLVIHARGFPGWASPGSFFRHLRFVRDHHRHIRHIALVADSQVASLASHVAEHFVKAAVKDFKYDELAAAIAWAGTTPAQT